MDYFKNKQETNSVLHFVTKGFVQEHELIKTIINLTIKAALHRP